MYLGELVNAQNSEPIIAFPHLPDNILVTNYARLQFNCHFDGSSYGVCRWALENRDNNMFINALQIYAEGLPCGNRNSDALEVKSICSNNRSVVNSTLTILIGLNYNFTIYVQCAKDIISPLDTISSDDFYVKGE